MRILALIEHYLPGFKAGGPIRSLSNMVDRLSAEFEFLIVAQDRDFGDRKPYSSVDPRGRWQNVGKAQVRYLPPGGAGVMMLRRILQETKYDVLYLNSFFSFRYSILPMLMRSLRLIPRRPVILAPRGEFSSGALSQKRCKKQTYLRVAQLLGLYRKIVWQASSRYEAEDIRRRFGARSRIHIAPAVPERVDVRNLQRTVPKRPSSLRAVFLSRVAKMKNLLGALDLLSSLRGNVIFDIYGTITESAYWDSCQRAIAKMPDNICVRYMGSVPNTEVRSVFASYDVFLLPTFGENYGHVIPEALSVGCPVLISDRTPWRGLERRGVGWDLPLSDREGFVTVLQQLVDMDEAEHATLRSNARDFGAECMDARDVVAANEALFRCAVVDERQAT
ncbi:MAG TPA: glycosyltransferase family 4 protein [Longimicrobiales bacterium]